MRTLKLSAGHASRLATGHGDLESGLPAAPEVQHPRAPQSPACRARRRAGTPQCRLLPVELRLPLWRCLECAHPRAHAAHAALPGPVLARDVAGHGRAAEPAVRGGCADAQHCAACAGERVLFRREPGTWTRPRWGFMRGLVGVRAGGFQVAGLWVESRLQSHALRSGWQGAGSALRRAPACCTVLLMLVGEDVLVRPLVASCSCKETASTSQVI